MLEGRGGGFAGDQTLSFGGYLIQVGKAGESTRHLGQRTQDILLFPLGRELERHAFRGHSRIGGNRDIPRGSPSGEPRSGASAHGLFAESYLMQRRDDPHPQLSRSTPTY